MIKGEPIIILLVEDDAAHAEIVSRNLISALEPYNKFSALLAKKICYLRLLSSSAGLGFYWLAWNRFPE